MTTNQNDMTTSSDEPTPGMWIAHPDASFEGAWEAHGVTREAAFEAALAFYVDDDIDIKEARELLTMDVKMGVVQIDQTPEAA